MSSLTAPVQNHTHPVQSGKKNEQSTYRLEVKSSLVTSDSMVYVENLIELQKKLPEVISEFSKIARCQVSIQKSVVCLYTHNEQLEMEGKA